MEGEEEGKEEEEAALYQYQEENKKNLMERYFTWKEKMEKGTEKQK